MESCFICRGEHFSSAFNKRVVNNHVFVKCKNCEMVTAVNTLNDALLSYDDFGGYLIKSKEEAVVEVRSHLERYSKTFKVIKDLYGPHATVLDFGAGAGYFVQAAMEYGFNAAGLEISKKLNHFSFETFGFKTFTRLSEIKDQFDVITMFDVIEHLPPTESKEILSGLIQLLKNGGALIGNTPNVDSLNVKLLKTSEPVIAPPSHICFYAPKTLDRYLDRLNMKKIVLTTHSFVAGSFFRKQKLLPSFLERAPKNRYWKYFVHLPVRVIEKVLDKFFRMFDMGYQIEFIYKKF